MNILLFSLSLVALVFWAVIMWYLRMLEKTGCECALDNHRTFLYVFAWAMIVYQIALMCVSVVLPRGALSIPMPSSLVWASVPLAILNVVYIVVAWNYIARLRREKCACADAPIQNIWRIVLIVQILLFILSVLSWIIVMVLVSIKAGSASSRGKSVISAPPTRQIG